MPHWNVLIDTQGAKDKGLHKRLSLYFFPDHKLWWILVIKRLARLKICPLTQLVILIYIFLKLLINPLPDSLQFSLRIASELVACIFDQKHLFNQIWPYTLAASISSTLIWLLYFLIDSYSDWCPTSYPLKSTWPSSNNSSHSQPESVQLLYASELGKPSVNFLIVPGSNWAICGAAVSHFELTSQELAWSHDKP